MKIILLTFTLGVTLGIATISFITWVIPFISHKKNKLKLIDKKYTVSLFKVCRTYSEAFELVNSDISIDKVIDNNPKIKQNTLNTLKLIAEKD